MSNNKEHLARMNRSGQRKGAVGSKPTVCTRLLLKAEPTTARRKNMTVLDFGAGKWAAQTAILRKEGFGTVTPYDVGENAHDEELLGGYGYDYILLSNVLNVQATMSDIRGVLATARKLAGPRAVLVANLPASPRYGTYEVQEVAEAISEAGWSHVGTYGDHRAPVWMAENWD